MRQNGQTSELAQMTSKETGRPDRPGPPNVAYSQCTRIKSKTARPAGTPYLRGIIYASTQSGQNNSLWRTLTGCAALSVLLAGCAPAPVRQNGFDLVIGSRGHVSGKFNRPRGIVHEPSSDMLYVVDWDGRIQKFTRDGRFSASWRMPEIDKGKPEDLCISSRTNLLVVDTHYSRVATFSLDGEWLRSFGSYGREPGQFIYPVGICCDADGNIYVSEYGENDRIQKFSPDGTWLKSWGRFGTRPGEFQRPSGIDISADGELFVADAVNHRVQVFYLDGELLRIIGREGIAPGEFRYPYDVAVRGEFLYVLEYGNQRVQKLRHDGQPVDSTGSGGSTSDGRFANPWRCATVADALYVSDTDNCRVVKLPDGF